MSWLRRFRRLSRYAVLALLCFLLFVSGFLWFITTDSFQQMVRRRLIASIEHATGGRVDLGSFHVVPLRFQVEVRNLTIHGREAPGELPLAHVDSMAAVVDLSSVLGARMAFRSLVLDHPVIHVLFYPDGTTNRPTPRQAGSASFDQLLTISIDRLEVHRGELLWQDQRLPLEFVTDNVQSHLQYSFLHQRYSGDISIGKAETSLDGYRPVAWLGQTDFSISKSELQLRSLEVSSGKSRLRAGGSITDLLHPVFQGTYDLQLDLQQAGSVVRDPRIRSGMLRTQGAASWSPQTFAGAGSFDLRDAAWNDQNVAVSQLAAAGKFSVDPQKLIVSQVQGRVLRGGFTSDAEIVGWNANQSSEAESKNRTPRGSVRFKAQDMALAELLSSLGPRFSPVKALKLSGNVSGSSTITWNESFRNAQMVAAVSVGRTDRTTIGQTPVLAATHFEYNARTSALQIDDFSARTPTTQAIASGTISNSSALKLSFSTSDVREWRPLMAIVFPHGLPLAVGGRAAFNGFVTGNVRRPTLAGSLQLQDFDTALPSRVSTPQLLHWDSLQAEVQASPNNLVLHNARLTRNNSSLHLDGSIALADWDISSSSAIHFHVIAENLDAAALAGLAGYQSKVTGSVSARFDLLGTIAKPLGQGSIAWSQASYQGYGFDSASAFVQLTGESVEINNLNISRAQAQVLGSGSYHLASREFTFDLKGSGFDLAQLVPVQVSRVKIGGSVEFSARGSGTLQKPNFSAQLLVRNLAVNDQTEGNFRVDATTRGPDMRLKGSSEFTDAELLVEGNVRLREQWPANLDFHFNHLDVNSFLRGYLQGHITGHSAVAGDLILQGPLRNPRLLSLTGNLSDLYAEIEKVQIRNDGPIRFNVSDERLNVNTFHIIGENTDFSLAGSMQLTHDRRLDFNGKGSLGLKLLQTYDPDLTGSGTVSGDIAVTGTASAPAIRGTWQITNGAVADINLPSALSDLNGTLLFNQNQITIQNLTGRTGGGTVSFNGHAQLEGKQVSFDLTASADSVRLRYPPGVSSTATAELRWSGTSSGSLLSGKITVTKLGVTPGFDFGAYLERSIQSAALPQTDPVLNSIRLDLHVLTTPELQMQTSVLRLRGDADLRVRGSAAKPVLLGRADVFEGEAYFNGTKYRLERGGITFGSAGAAAATAVPFIDLQATTHVRDYDITLSITGPADRPKLNYRSEPPLPTNDIIGLLAFGQTAEESAQLQQTSQSAFSQQASNAMLAAALNATLNNRTQRLFGNSSIKIDPQGLATETSPTQTGPAVSIEQQVKDNLTITYTTNVAQTSQQVIRAEYYVSRNVSIVAIRDQNGVVSFDVKIRRRKR